MERLSAGFMPWAPRGKVVCFSTVTATTWAGLLPLDAWREDTQRAQTGLELAIISLREYEAAAYLFALDDAIDAIPT
jgi:hypothetical protein